MSKILVSRTSLLVSDRHVFVVRGSAEIAIAVCGWLSGSAGAYVSMICEGPCERQISLLDPTDGPYLFN